MKHLFLITSAHFHNASKIAPISHLTVMVYSHHWIRIPIPIAIQTANQMATLYYVDLLHWMSQIQILILTANYGDGIGIGMRIGIRISECK